ncbi:MAG: hypothetical protein GXP05_03055 [Alphaproteobacteria bacterium]|nr:hypothetical protein [Alphaproteobacteria bacterium]
MPLQVLLPLVVIGITAIVLLIRAMRPTPPLTFATTDQAKAVWDHRNHDHEATRAHLNLAQTHALIETRQGIGLLWSFGVDPVTRHFRPPVACRQTTKGLRLVTHDFTAPIIDIPLTDRDIRTTWQQLLTAGTK